MPLFKGKDKEDDSEGDRKKMLPNMNLPSIDKTKIKGSLKCVKWIQKKIQKKGAAFPLFMILLNAAYLTLGGLLFMALERQPKVVVNTSQELVEIFNVLKNSEIRQNLSLPSGINVPGLVQNLTSKDLGKFDDVLSRITSQRMDAAKKEWNIYNSVFFCMTVTTTIGYGNLSPVTVAGRVICVIYALLGIPLTLALLAIVGKILGDYINDACAWLLKWYRKVHKSYEYERTVQDGDDGQVDAPLWMGLLILLFFTTLMAGLFCWIEGWDFGTSLYFQYITYLTIGFGDVVPQKEQLVFVNIFLVFLGLSVLSITLSMIASNIHHQMQKASFIEKLKDTELSDSSFVGSAVGVGDEENGDGNGNKGRRGSGDDSAITTQDSNGGKTYGSTENSP
ncbi:TWiK family of potassium channels protein 7-like [Stylophora pistillata]|uniref:TWiK family of potassium channels protein 7 n=1 Tax=Stylophora pistillata TaxID=50429 RepID=A0A2B4RGD2_STYPI|nr:TWiK family of potassium channels protein 7-like [Stylophora pistillata]PFX15869.1 TWiK family of potassium channels protein 7 [Stylophora pistillata]